MESYRFMEVSLSCADCAVQEDFWLRMFGGQVLFRGQMAGQPFSRILTCGITLIFRQDRDFQPPPGPGVEFQYRNHLGLRVDDLERAIADLESRGAKFVMTPALVRQYQQKTSDTGQKYLQTDFMADPLTPDRIAAGEYKHDVAIFVGPDNLWIELNEVREPADIRWYPR